MAGEVSVTKVEGGWPSDYDVKDGPQTPCLQPLVCELLKLQFESECTTVQCGRVTMLPHPVMAVLDKIRYPIVGTFSLSVPAQLGYAA